MSEWITQARAAVKAGERLAMVTVVGAQGSTPRETGARMLVWDDHFTGTIGGGSLERQALDQARKFLTQTQRRHALQDYPLGPLLGQCCGGGCGCWSNRSTRAALAMSRRACAEGDPFGCRRALRMARSRGPGRRAGRPPTLPHADPGGGGSELMQPTKPKLVIFGAATGPGGGRAPCAPALRPVAGWPAARPPEAGGTRAEVMSEDDLDRRGRRYRPLFAIFTHSHDLITG